MQHAPAAPVMRGDQTRQEQFHRPGRQRHHSPTNGLGSFVVRRPRLPCSVQVTGAFKPQTRAAGKGPPLLVELRAPGQARRESRHRLSPAPVIWSCRHPSRTCMCDKCYVESLSVPTYPATSSCRHRHRNCVPTRALLTREDQCNPARVTCKCNYNCKHVELPRWRYTSCKH